MPRFYCIVDFAFDPEWTTSPIKVFELGAIDTSDILALDELRQIDNQEPLSHLIESQRKTDIASEAIAFREASSAWFKKVQIGEHNFNGSNIEYYISLIESRIRMEQSNLHLNLRPLNIRSDMVLGQLHAQLDHYAELPGSHSVICPSHISCGLQLACIDKVVSYIFFAQADIAPPSFLFNLSSLQSSAMPDLAAFIEAAPDWLFIKPTNKSCGKGGEVVHKTKLMERFEAINTARRFASGRSYKVSSDGYWEETSDPYVLIQHCTPSGMIRHHEKPMRPTGRAVVEYDSDTNTTRALDGFWKLPAAPDDASFSTEVIKSFSGTTDGFPALRISPEHWIMIESWFATKFHHVVTDMADTRLNKLYQRIATDPNLSQYLRTDRLPPLLTNVSQAENTPTLIDAWVNNLNRYFNRLTYGSPGSLEAKDGLMLAVAGLGDDEIVIIQDALSSLNLRRDGYESRYRELLLLSLRRHLYQKAKLPTIEIDKQYATSIEQFKIMQTTDDARAAAWALSNSRASLHYSAPKRSALQQYEENNVQRRQCPCVLL